MIVVNDTLAALRAATPDAVGLAVPVSTGGNVIGRARDGRVTDRGHGIFGGGYVLGALGARGARTGIVGEELASEVDAAGLSWRGRRPGPEAALLGAAVARAAEHGDPYPCRMVDRWCARVALAVREEAARLDLGDERPSSSTAGSGKPRPGWRPGSGRPSSPERRAHTSLAWRWNPPPAPLPSPSMAGGAPRSHGTSRPAGDHPTRPPVSPRAPQPSLRGPVRTSAGP